MNKIVQIKIFNDILDQFFDYLEHNFPDFRSDLILTRSTAEFIRKSNPRLVVEQFMTSVIPYQKEIFSCNENFFLDFESNLSSSELTSENLLVGLKIKTMWLSSDTSEQKKAWIWLYFQKLLKAGEKVLN
jgi:hypothetical protein